MIRFFTLIFCALVVTMQAQEKPEIKNTHRERAIEKAIGSFLGAIVIGIIACGAHEYAKEAIEASIQLPLAYKLLGFASSLKNQASNAYLVCLSATVASILLVINGLCHVLDAAAPAQPLSQD